jgi:hypothetical protein
VSVMTDRSRDQTSDGRFALRTPNRIAG